jgi:hypothetical protein
MNERIRELREQAWALVSNEERDRGELYEAREQWERCDQKFAELIVAECIEQVRGEFLPVLEDKEMMKDTHWDGYVQCGVDSIVAIREHFFGVEE